MPTVPSVLPPQPISNADFIVPVEIEGTTHQVKSNLQSMFVCVCICLDISVCVCVCFMVSVVDVCFAVLAEL